MVEHHTVQLWRDFPKTLSAFEERFGSEQACRDYLAQCRWNSAPRCAKCGCQKVWRIHDGAHLECADCGHQTSLTSGTLFRRVENARGTMNAQTAQAVVPRDMGGLRAQARHFGSGPAAYSGLWVL